MGQDVMGHFIERRKKPWGRSASEIVIAIAAVIGLGISLFTGIRAFYVNEYRIDVMEQSVKEVRAEIKDAHSDIKEMDRSVQRLLGAATKQGWVEENLQRRAK